MNEDFLLPDYDRSRALTLVSAPSAEPVTLASAKLFLRVEHSADDEAITRAIVAARQAAEQYLHLAILPQVWDYKVGTPRSSSIALPLGPAQSITSVTATSLTAGSSTVSASNYRLSVDGWKVIFVSLPYTDIVTVRYSASIAATVNDVPALIVQGILHHVAAMMQTRDGSAPMPKQAMDCYQPFRRVRV